MIALLLVAALAGQTAAPPPPAPQPGLLQAGEADPSMPPLMVDGTPTGDAYNDLIFCQVRAVLGIFRPGDTDEKIIVAAAGRCDPEAKVLGAAVRAYVRKLNPEYSNEKNDNIALPVFIHVQERAQAFERRWIAYLRKQNREGAK